MKLKDLKEKEEIAELIKSDIPKLNKAPQFQYHLNYYDGPLSGICIHNGQPCYFKMVAEYEPRTVRLFAVVALTRREMANEEYVHGMFEKYVGTHTRYDYIDDVNYRVPLEGTTRSKEDKDYFYKTVRPALKYNKYENNEVVAWWDEQDINNHRAMKEKNLSCNEDKEKQKLLVRLFKSNLLGKVYDQQETKYNLKMAAKSFHEKLAEERTNGKIMHSFEAGREQYTYEAELQSNKYNMRIHHVAYALLKGQPYGKIEQKINLNKIGSVKRFAADVYNVYSQYIQEGSGLPVLTCKDIEDAILERGSHGKALES